MTYVDWPVDDPGGRDQATVRRIVADLAGRLREVLVELVPDLDLPLGEVHVRIAPSRAWLPTVTAFMRDASSTS